MTTDPQDRIIKQLEDRYPLMTCTQESDGSLKIHCRRTGTGNVLWERTVVVGANGRIIRDGGEQDTDDYSDFADQETTG